MQSFDASQCTPVADGGLLFASCSPASRHGRSRYSIGLGTLAIALEQLDMNMDAAQTRSFLGSKLGLAVTLSLAVLGAYLLWNHTGHVVYALPYLFLLACPLLHVFGHHHGHHHKPEDTK